MKSSLQSLLLGASLLGAPIAANAQDTLKTNALCKQVPDFRVMLVQNGITLPPGQPETNQPGSPLLLRASYDSTRQNTFSIKTDPPGGKAGVDAPLYLRDKDGSTFKTRDDLHNRRVDAAFNEENDCGTRRVHMILTPRGRAAPAPVAPAPKPDTAKTVVQTPATATATANAQVNVYITLPSTAPPAPAKSDSTPPLPPPLIAPQIITQTSELSGYIGLLGGVTSVTGSKRTGPAYHTIFPLTTETPKFDLGLEGTLVYTKNDRVAALFELQRIGAGGMHVTLTRPQGTVAANEEVRSFFTDAELTGFLLANRALGVRVGVSDNAVQINENIAKSAAIPGGVTANNPTVHDTKKYIEVVMGPAAFNASLGYASQSLDKDPLTSGGSGPTGKLSFNGMLLKEVIPVNASVRHARFTGKDLLGPDGMRPYHGSITTARAEIAPLAFIMSGPLAQSLRFGGRADWLGYEAGTSNPRNLRSFYVAAGLAIGNSHKTGGNK